MPGIGSRAHPGNFTTDPAELAEILQAAAAASTPSGTQPTSPRVAPSAALELQHSEPRSPEPALGAVLLPAATDTLCSETSLEMSRRSMLKRIEDFSCSMETSRELGAAAEASGAMARGPVTMAIRAKAVCRLAASTASRRMLHRIADPDAPPFDVDEPLSRNWDRRASEASISSHEKDGRTVACEAWGDLPDRSPSSSSSAPWKIQRHDLTVPAVEEERSGGFSISRGNNRLREIQVPQNTTLGRMVRQDPVRAAKYDLVLVPPWSQNKPWPPPPIKMTRRVPRRESLHSDGDVAENTPSFSRWGRMRVVSQMVAMCAAAQRKTTKSPSELMKIASSNLQAAKEEQEMEVDFFLARTAFSHEEEEYYTGIFSRYSAGNSGQLSIQGLQRAMREAGITASNVAEQDKFKKVQKQVLEYARGKEGMEESNPLASKKGFWMCDEFLLMVAGMKQLNMQERWKANEALAVELGLDPNALEEFRNVFDEFDIDGSGSIGVQELQKLLALANLHPTDKELKLLLRRLGVGDELTFTEFLQIMVKVEEFVRPNKA